VGHVARLLLITGDRHKGEAIDVEKGRYGLRWLRDDDDQYSLATLILAYLLASSMTTDSDMVESDFVTLNFFFCFCHFLYT